MDQRKNEIRAILMGFIRYEDIYIIAAENVLYSSFMGLFQGASAARFRGLKEIRRQYRLPAGKVYGNSHIVEAFLSMGSPVFLFSAPDASGILHRPLLTNPVMITVEAEKSEALVCFYTARTLWAKLTLNRVAKKLEKALPQNFRPTEVTMTPFVPPEEKDEAEKGEKAAPKKHEKEKNRSRKRKNRPKEEDSVDSAEEKQTQAPSDPGTSGDDAAESKRQGSDGNGKKTNTPE